MERFFLLKISTVNLFLFSTAVFSHGLIENPASREQFCGVESKPHEIYGQLTHEKCRPIMTKSDGSLDTSVYNFMAVLTHTTGRQGRTQNNLPTHVCGFNSENWGGGATPWDHAMDWPTNTISAGENQFVWNISWGNHFGDTEEFAYWITKPDFKFDSTKELSWNDFEETPFCVLKYDDKNPNDNPNIVTDKINNKFITTCQVPSRQNRAVIYAEWGRNYATFERFHSCIDVTFSGSSQQPSVKAVISSVSDTIKGDTEINLDANQSQGENLSYHWSFTANDPKYYLLQDANTSHAKLIMTNPAAEQLITINLSVQQGEITDTTSITLHHLPATNDEWKQVGSALTNNTLAAGDQISLRLIDKEGNDLHLPSSPLLLNTESAQPMNWSYYLAQAINGKNDYSVEIGVLDEGTGTITPTLSAIENKVYVSSQSDIDNAYLSIIKKEQTPETCFVQRKNGSGPYWLGYDIYSSTQPIMLDFTRTGIDLSNVKIDAGVFQNVTVLSKYKLLINSKPSWVSSTNPGYIGFNASNYQPLTTTVVAACAAG